MPESAPSAFISYSRQDSEFVLRLAQDLKAAGANVWLDQIDIRPGTSWDNSIEEALHTASQMLVVLSPTSAKSENVRDEFSYALDQGKVVVPVLYLECDTPFRLRRKQHIDLRVDYARGLTHLLDHLQTARSDISLPPEAVERDAERNTGLLAGNAEAEGLRALDERQPEKSEDSNRKSDLLFFQKEAEHKAEQIRLKEAEETRAKEESDRRGAAQHEELIRHEREAKELRTRWAKQPNDQAEPQSTSRLPPHAQAPVSPYTSNPARSGISTIPKSAPAHSPISSPIPLARRSPRADLKESAALVAGVIILLFLGMGAVGAFFQYQDRPAARLNNFQKACDSGNASACGLQGEIYYSGNAKYDASKDVPKAATLWGKGCEAGSAYDCVNLGDLYANGDGVTKDMQRAATLWAKACDAKAYTACDYLGVIYFTGNGVDKNLVLAKQFFQKACAQANQHSCDELKRSEFPSA